MSELNADSAGRFVDQIWGDSILPSLADYIRIPNKSPMFDAEWATHGHMDEAVKLMFDWCDSHRIPGMTLDVVRLPGRTPLLFMDVPGDTEGCVLLYGHLDKQPEMIGWADHLGPWKPVVENERLYGRGGADDGYAVFASLAALHALRDQGFGHPRCCIVIEACEESGSYDLPYYLDALEDRIGTPDLVICLDSGCGNYDQLWITTSLRGVTAGTLSAELISEGVHSGDAGGLVADSFRVIRQLLQRLEDADSGEVKPAALRADIPAERVEQARLAARVLGKQVYAKLPFLSETRPASEDLVELVLNRTWRPALTVTGAAGLPAVENAGNVCRPGTDLKLSMRLPPTCDAEGARLAMKELLERDPPYGARVRFDTDQTSDGWNAPPVQPWLREAADQASRSYFGAPTVYMGEGGTIPFMGMLGEKYPGAQILVTGVLGPQSNAHGPNEFLHIPTGKKITACVADILVEHASRNR